MLKLREQFYPEPLGRSTAGEIADLQFALQVEFDAPVDLARDREARVRAADVAGQHEMRVVRVDGHSCPGGW